MILPKKHLTLYESLLGLSGYVLRELEKENLTIDEIWKKYQKIDNSKEFPAKHTFDDLILSIDFLYSLNKISVDKDGVLMNETS